MASDAEMQSRQVAEESREKEWLGASFLKELFLGRLRLDLVEPHPIAHSDRPEFLEFYGRLRDFLQDVVDPVAIDASGEYPKEVVSGLAELGAFGMKIDTEYGGLGLTHLEYVQVMRLVGSYDANVTALLSAHQAIGVPQPVKLFGSEHLKRTYLPRCAKGAISAFALTEPAVGSDPARLSSIAEPTEDGEAFILNGEKLWCTNGTLAEVIVVMARDPGTERINAFVVETDWPGVEVTHRCRFMGLKALANAHMTFRDVRIPRENLIGEEGAGLKIALVTLNTGRLTLPAATSGVAKGMVETCRKWSNARVQWGVPIGKHEAIAHKLADMTSKAFAMEAVGDLVGGLAQQPDMDIRLEAAAAKEWNTVQLWEILDEALQVRGGRGYETERSLAGRGEPPVPIERLLRDARINLIFEGSSEIMHLFMAREAVDEHLRVAGTLVDPKASVGAKIAALPKIALHYARWYPSRWVGWGWWPRFKEYGRLARHVRFIDRMARKLARQIFHGMVVHRAKMERKQAYLFRCVDVAMELFAMSASVTRVRRLRALGTVDAAGAERVADMFCRGSRRRVRALFRDLWRNDDVAQTAFGKEVLAGRYTWLEEGIFGLPYDVEALTPPSVSETLERRRPATGGEATTGTHG